MTLQPVPTELCSQLDEAVAERKMGHCLPIAYVLETILAERTYALAWVAACSAGEVKEAVVAEIGAGAGFQLPGGTGSRSFCRGSAPASSTGRSCPAVSVPADRPRMGSATPVSHHRLIKTALIVFSAGVKRPHWC